MALIKNKEQLKGLIRTTFINSNSNLPDFEYAEELYLLPLIGQAVYEQMLALANSSNPPPANPTEQQLREEELLKRCRRLVAPMAYLLELPLMHARLNDTGLQTVSMDGFTTAHRWEYLEVQNHFIDRGALAIESLLNYLFLHKESFPSWLETEGYNEAQSLVFKTGEEFNKYFSLTQPQRLFWELRPLIREVEDFYIKPSIGEAFFAGLKEQEAPNDKEKAVLLFIKKAVAQITIVKAIEKLSCKMTPQGFTVLLSAGNGDTKNAGDAVVKDNQLSLLYESCSRSGDDYIMQLKDYLNATATSQVFADYYNSSYYKKPVDETKTMNPNDGKKIFGML